MNCRILEHKVFPDPAVAGILRDNFIEARLHTDGAPGPANVKIRDRFTTAIANPWLVVVDPVTETVLGETGFVRQNELAAFLQSVL